MADEISLHESGPERGGTVRGLFSAYWFPFLLTIVLTAGCYAAAGATLGAFIGGLVVVAVVTPGAVMAEEGWIQRAVAWAAVVDAALVVWLAPVVRGVISFGDWVEAVTVLAAFTAAIVGLVTALRWVRLNAVLAAGLTVVVGLAWLSWPVWMAPWLTGENRETVVACLVWGHPLFALDGAMLDAFGTPWAQMPIAYQLTNVGDDIGYEMPRSVWACVGVHLAVVVGLVAPQILVARRENNPSAEDPTAAA